MTQPLFLVLRDGAKVLADAGIDNAPRDVRLLLAQAVGLAPDRITLERDRQITDEEQAIFQGYLSQRITRQPVSQILQRKEFWGRTFEVTPDVLTPRPETEFLIEVALAQPFDRVLDLGTGSGAIAVTLLAERQNASGVATDISPMALAVARRNSAKFDTSDRLNFIQSDWFSDVEDTFDLIVSNPPYITENEMAALDPEVREWEPNVALTPGGDGLAAYKSICAHAKTYLNPGGRIIFEIGFLQSTAVTTCLDRSGFCNISTVCDLDGKDRIVIGNDSCSG